jgi:hypothetical protein
VANAPAYYTKPVSKTNLSPGPCKYVISLNNILAYFDAVVVTKKKYYDIDIRRGQLYVLIVGKMELGCYAFGGKAWSQNKLLVFLNHCI